MGFAGGQVLRVDHGHETPVGRGDRLVEPEHDLATGPLEQHADELTRSPATAPSTVPRRCPRSRSRRLNTTMALSGAPAHDAPTNFTPASRAVAWATGVSQ